VAPGADGIDFQDHAMYRRIILSTLALVLAATAAAAAEKPAVLDVWPGKPPGEKGGVGEENSRKQKSGRGEITIISNVTQPTLTVFLPPKEKNTGAAVVICPGGGYNILAWDLEGEEVATWLNSIGVTGIILKYRVPRRPGDDKKLPPVAPLLDAQRALSLVRSKADEFGIDPKRIGILGFSAGGHLAASASVGFGKRSYDPIDDVDKVSCRPDFAILIYPAYLTDTESPPVVQRVPKDAPPMFLAHAGDDPVTVESSTQLYEALKKVGVRADLHVYARGGHGFGLRPSDLPCSRWPQRCEEWLRSEGLLKAR
jgi:acetyl esterase/lipase